MLGRAIDRLTTRGATRRGFARAAALVAFACALPGADMVRDGAEWVQVDTGFVSAGALGRLRIEGHGLVIVRGGGGNQVSWRMRKRVAGGVGIDRAKALMAATSARLRASGVTAVVATSAPPEVVTELEVRVPLSLRLADVESRFGDVILRDLPLDVQAVTGGGRVDADGVAGGLRARTGFGEVRLGRIGGAVRVDSGGGPVLARSLGAEAWLETAGGEIFVESATGDLHAATGAGDVRILRAGAGVNARTTGGMIRVTEARGAVVADSGGGPILAGGSPVRCETLAGSIIAQLFAARALADSMLSTGVGDITVLIPSDLSVTVNAISEASRSGRIVSDFPEIRVHGGTADGRTVATGALNGGGPLLKVAAARGSVYLKRQR